MSVLPSPLNAAIEAGIRSLLKLDPDVRQELSVLENKVIAINVTQPPVSVSLSFVDQQVSVLGMLDEPADTTITGSLDALKSLSSGNDALYQGRLKIEGDLAVGRQFKDIVTNLNPDWESVLSPVLGDTLVHRIAVTGQSFFNWLDRSKESMRLNTSEYLQEEVELIAPDSEIHIYCQQVDDVRAAADRLEARIQRLEELRETRIRERSLGVDNC